jgi:hypothetical protein
MPNFTSWVDQVLSNSLSNNGSVYIVVELQVREEIWEPSLGCQRLWRINIFLWRPYDHDGA